MNLALIFNQLQYLNLLWVVAVVAVLVVLAIWARRRALARFASNAMMRRLAPQAAPIRRYVKAGCVLAAMLALVVGMLDPRWGRHWRELPQRGIDVIFALDVSRSMLARDTAPNRLGQARQMIKDMVGRMHGDRVGLVTFAGTSQQKVPLTNNYHDLTMALDAVGPHSVQRGGSKIGDAIRAATACFVDKTAGHKAIVLISDGEDQDSMPIEAARAAAKEKGIRLFTIGLGDAESGTTIPTGAAGQPLMHQGKAVITKMQRQTLEQVALAGDGAFIPAGTQYVDMAQVYDRYISGIQQRAYEQARVNSYIPRYQWFAAAALVLLLADLLISERRRVARAVTSTYRMVLSG